MTRLYLTVICLVILLSSNGPVASQHLKAAMFDLDPWATKDGNGYSGIIPTIIHEMEQQLGLPIATTMVSYPRMVKMLKVGDVDFAIFFQSKMSREIAFPLQVFYQIRTSVIVSKKAREEAELAKRKLNIATARGLVFDTAFDTSERYIKVYSNNHPHSVQLLVQGRVDGIAGPESTLFNLLKKADPAGDYQVQQVINTNKITLQFSKNSRHMEAKAALDRAAKTIWTPDFIDKLSMMFPNLPSTTAVPFGQQQ